MLTFPSARYTKLIHLSAYTEINVCPPAIHNQSISIYLFYFFFFISTSFLFFFVGRDKLLFHQKNRQRLSLFSVFISQLFTIQLHLNNQIFITIQFSVLFFFSFVRYFYFAKMFIFPRIRGLYFFIFFFVLMIPIKFYTSLDFVIQRNQKLFARCIYVLFFFSCVRLKFFKNKRKKTTTKEENSLHRKKMMKRNLYVFCQIIHLLNSNICLVKAWLMVISVCQIRIYYFRFVCSFIRLKLAEIIGVVLLLLLLLIMMM